jgi:hypothetical protein
MQAFPTSPASLDELDNHIDQAKAITQLLINQVGTDTDTMRCALHSLHDTLDRASGVMGEIQTATPV